MINLLFVNLFGHISIKKVDYVITNESMVHSKVVFQSISITKNEQPLFSYPAKTNFDSISNAFEMIIENQESERRVTCTSSAMFIHLLELITLLNDVFSWIRSNKRPDSSVLSPVSPIESKPKEESNSFILFNIDIREMLKSLTLVNVFIRPVQVVLSEDIHFFTPTITIATTTDSEDAQKQELSMIVKDFCLLYRDQPVVRLNDLMMILDFINYTIHCSSQNLAISLSPAFIHSLLLMSTQYEAFLSMLYADVKSLDESLEHTEVVTEGSIYLRSSLDRMSIDKDNLLRRRSSCSQGDSAQEPAEERKRIISVFKFSYVLDTMQLTLVNETQTVLKGSLQNCSFYVDEEEIQLGCQQVRLTQDADDYVLVESFNQAFNLVCTISDYLQCSVSLGNFGVNVNLDRVGVLLHELPSFIPEMPKSSRTPKSPKPATNDERKHVLFLLSISQSSVSCFYSSASFYLLKVIQMRLQYEQLPTHSDQLSFQLQNFFIADTSNRLLLTDFSCQLDVERLYYRTGDILSVQFLVPKVDAAIQIEDVEHLLLLLHHFIELFSHSHNAPAIEPENAAETRKPSSEMRVKLQLNDVHLELSKPNHCLSTTLSAFYFSFQTGSLEKSERMLALGSLRCVMDEIEVLSFKTLPFSDNVESLCLCIDREPHKKEHSEWFYVYVGDLCCAVTPDLIDLCVLSFFNLPVAATTFSSPSTPATSSSPSSNSSVSTASPKPVRSTVKYGISVNTQSVQMRLLVPYQTSFIMAFSSLNAIVSTVSAHVELQRACILLDKDNAHFSTDIYQSNLATFTPIVDECKIVLSVDIPADLSPRLISLDIQDITMAIDDQFFSRLSLVLSVYQPLLNWLTTRKPDVSSLESDSCASYSFSNDSFIDENVLPNLFELSQLQIVLQDIWPEEKQLVVIPSLFTTSESIKVFPTLDYYHIINGGIPQILPIETVREQKYLQQTEPQKSFFSFWSQPRDPNTETSPLSIKMQFRFPNFVRIFSIVVKNLTRDSIEQILGAGSSVVFGDCLEFDLLAWSEINRSFQYIKSVCVSIAETAVAVSLPPFDTGVSKEEASASLHSVPTSEFFEMTPPYSYSSRYQIIVHLRRPATTSITRQALLTGVAKLIASNVSFRYFISLHRFQER